MKNINDYKTQVDKILLALQKDIAEQSDLAQLHFLKSKYLGKKAEISELLKSISAFDSEQKAEIGKIINNAKNEILVLINQKIITVEQAQLTKQLQADAVDVSLPGKHFQIGHQNPLFLVVEEISAFFKSLGYQIINGTEIDNEEFNFNRLNLPQNHPARAMQDTFYLEQKSHSKNRGLLRTHCTNMTARILSAQKGKIDDNLAYISLGNVYRNDDDDATHSHQFMQVDAFLVGHDVTFANLKWTLTQFCQKLFGKQTKIRLRPSYFPFTEPSAEVDVSCPLCATRGCSLCKFTGWIEILGSGMIHPNVFLACGIEDSSITGFAFGVGIERIAMIKYSIDDIRLFYNNDIRFLKQF